MDPGVGVEEFVGQSGGGGGMVGCFRLRWRELRLNQVELEGALGESGGGEFCWGASESGGRGLG